jgi:TadE-like protein
VAPGPAPRAAARRDPRSDRDLRSGPDPRSARDPRSDRGQAAIELLGVLPVLLLIALVGVQLGMVAYAASQASTAARAAARTASQDLPGQSPQAAGEAAVSDWLHVQIQVGESDEDVTATARIKVPSLIPGIGGFGPVTRTAQMPKE